MKKICLTCKYIIGNKTIDDELYLVCKVPSLLNEGIRSLVKSDYCCDKWELVDYKKK